MDMEQVIEAAKYDEAALNELIISNTDFILRIAGSTTRTYIDKSSDEWSIALIAFNEAVLAYSTDKGNFHAFASLVIKRRLTDLLRKKMRRKSEISVAPAAFSGNYDEADGVDKSLQSEIIKKIAYSPSDDLKYEILAISDTLDTYNISFSELADSSPKAAKTKLACGNTIKTIIDNFDLLTSLKKSKTLPIKILEKEYKLHRKILERHRKYIIAGVEILSGDYPYLKEYMKFVKDL